MQNETVQEQMEAKKTGVDRITVQVTRVSMDQHTLTKRVHMIISVPRENGKSQYGIECYGEREVTVDFNE